MGGLVGGGVIIISLYEYLIVSSESLAQNVLVRYSRLNISLSEKTFCLQRGHRMIDLKQHFQDIICPNYLR